MNCQGRAIEAHWHFGHACRAIVDGPSRHGTARPNCRTESRAKAQTASARTASRSRRGDAAREMTGPRSVRGGVVDDCHCIAGVAVVESDRRRGRTSRARCGHRLRMCVDVRVRCRRRRLASPSLRRLCALARSRSTRRSTRGTCSGCTAGIASLSAIGLPGAVTPEKTGGGDSEGGIIGHAVGSRSRVAVGSPPTALYARQLAEQQMQSDVVLREEWARGPQHRLLWVVSIADRGRRPVSVAPAAGTAYADEIRIRREASREPELSHWDRVARSAPLDAVPWLFGSFAVAVRHLSMAFRVMSRTSSRL